MLSKEDVLKIAALSKLSFQDEEVEKFQLDLNKIFEHIETLEEIDTTNIKPLFNVLDLEDKVREDVVIDSHIKNEILANAPEHDKNFIIVPKIINE